MEPDEDLDDDQQIEYLSQFDDYEDQFDEWWRE